MNDNGLRADITTSSESERPDKNWIGRQLKQRIETIG